jgi:hypothetical protein
MAMGGVGNNGWASSNATTQGKSEFIHFQDRPSDYSFVEKVWRCRSERADSFLSVAANTSRWPLRDWEEKAFSSYVDQKPQQLPLIVLRRESGSESVLKSVPSCRDFSRAVYGITKM